MSTPIGFGSLFNRVFTIDNLDSRYTGFGNKLGRLLLAYREFLRRFKK